MLVNKFEHGGEFDADLGTEIIKKFEFLQTVPVPSINDLYQIDTNSEIIKQAITNTEKMVFMSNSKFADRQFMPNKSTEKNLDAFLKLDFDESNGLIIDRMFSEWRKEFMSVGQFTSIKLTSNDHYKIRLLPNKMFRRVFLEKLNANYSETSKMQQYFWKFWKFSKVSLFRWKVVFWRLSAEIQ